MIVRIWGCRGSLATPGPDTVRYGGNTACVEVALADGAVCVLDAGTGIRELGQKLLERGSRRIQLLLSHLHFDHLEGLRFFAPLWDENVTLDVWGPRSPVSSLQERIKRSFSPPIFPIDFEDLPARVTFHDIPKGRWKVPGATLTSGLVLHPGPTVGFRVEADGSSVAYLPDHEPALAGPFAERSRDWISGGLIAEDAALLLHDTQYFEDEYEERIGWGHSSVESAVAFTNAVGARRLVLFHHDPDHDDETLERLEARARSLAPGHEHPPTLAREGMVFELP